MDLRARLEAIAAGNPPAHRGHVLTAAQLEAVKPTAEALRELVRESSRDDLGRLPAPSELLPILP